MVGLSWWFRSGWYFCCRGGFRRSVLISNGRKGEGKWGYEIGAVGFAGGQAGGTWYMVHLRSPYQ